MPKRFTDTDKWKKGFIRSLEGPYKLLWFYILDDCDHAGIWQVDFEVARIRTGEQLDKQRALNLFAGRIEVINGGSKWFIRDFIDFQYGELNPANRMHLSVINILKKNEISPISSPLEGAKDKVKDKDMVKVKEITLAEFEKLLDDEIWQEQLMMNPVYKGKNLKECIQKAHAFLSVEGRLAMGTTQEFKKCVQAFMNNERQATLKKSSTDFLKENVKL